MFRRISIGTHWVRAGRNSTGNLHHLCNFPVSFLKRTGEVDDVYDVAEIVFIPEKRDDAKFDLNEEFGANIDSLRRCSCRCDRKVLASVCTCLVLAQSETIIQDLSSGRSFGHDKRQEEYALLWRVGTVIEVVDVENVIRWVIAVLSKLSAGWVISLRESYYTTKVFSPGTSRSSSGEANTDCDENTVRGMARSRRRTDIDFMLSV